MTLLPDSGDPGNEFDKLKLDQQKPELLTEATWQHLIQEYQLRGELGKGGQALVLQVKERKAPHARRAIKVYHENTDAAKKLFAHEARVIASDHLPQDLVVGYYAAVDLNGIQPYLVLEFIDGETIADWSQRRMPVEHRIALWEKLLRALHRLHLCHLVFGDLSSKNVMVGKDDTIRFIDLAGAQNFKRAYSSAQSRGSIKTEIYFPEGADGAALWTDLYAASAIGFLILTGKDKSAVPKEQWEVGLKASGIPGEICRIVLKGLREKDTTKTEDPTLYPSAEHLANDISHWREGLVRRERRKRQTLLTTVLLTIVGAFGFVGWQRYYEAVASSDLKVWQSLQGEIRELPNRTHPAVAKLLADEKALITQREEADNRQDRAASRTATASLLGKSREILTVAREIDRAEQQRIAIGKLLLEDEATKTSGFWITAAPAIQAQLTTLQQRYRSIAERVRAGQTDKLATDLAQLQTDLAELFKVNIEARSAFDARSAFQRFRELVPTDRLTQDGLPVVQSGADQAEKAWIVAAWDGGQSLILARQLFGSATQQLDGWLKRNLKPAELAAIEKNSQTRVTELSTEVATLRVKIDAQISKVNALNQQIVDQTKKQSDTDKQLADATTRLTTEQKSREDADAKVTQLTQTATEESQKLKAAIEKQTALQTALDTTAPDLAKAQADLKTAQEQLASLTQARDKALADAQRWKKLATETPGVQTALSEKLAALEAEIVKIDPKDRDAAHAALVKAATEYRQLEAERTELVKPDAYEEKHPKVKAKDAELAQAAATLTTALKKRDSADQLAFDTLQQQIDLKQKLHDDEHEKGLRLPNLELVKLRGEITTLKMAQATYAEGKLRAVAANDAPALTIPDILRISVSVTQTRELAKSKGSARKPAEHFFTGTQIRPIIRALRQVAYSIDQIPNYQVRSLADIASVEAEFGETESARREFAEARSKAQHDTLAYVIINMAQAGLLEGSQHSNLRLLSDRDRIDALSSIAIAQAKAQDIAAARQSIQEYLTIKPRVKGASDRNTRHIAIAQAECDDYSDALATARSIAADSPSRLVALVDVAERDMTPGRIEELAKEILPFHSCYEKTKELVRLAKMAHDRGDRKAYDMIMKGIIGELDQQDSTELFTGIAFYHAVKAETYSENIPGAIAIAEKVKNPHARSWVYTKIACEYYDLGKMEDARSMLQIALMAARSTKDADYRMRILSEYVPSLAQRPKLYSCAALADEMKELLERVPVGDGRDDRLVDLVDAFSFSGNMNEANKCVLLIGDDYDRMKGHLNIALAYARADDNDAEQKSLNTVYSIARGLPEDDDVAHFFVSYAVGKIRTLIRTDAD